MKARSKDIGTAGETAVVKYLRENGFGGAERRALRGSLDCGDITGCGPLVIEVKAGAAAMNASDGQVEKWIEETDTERANAGADLGVLVLKRKGKGSAGDWWAVEYMNRPQPLAAHPVRYLFSDWVLAVRANGHGDPL